MSKRKLLFFKMTSLIIKRLQFSNIINDNKSYLYLADGRHCCLPELDYERCSELLLGAVTPSESRETADTAGATITSLTLQEQH